MLSNQEIVKLAQDSSEIAWHALYTRHQHEKMVAQTLTGKGFEVFLPQYTTVHRWKDRNKNVVLPLFPNYVFIHGGLDRMLNIVTTPGVHSLISWGGRPAVVPAEEIDAVRRVLESQLPVEPHPYLQCGDLVRIKCGALEGIQGILIRRTRSVRLVLSVEMLSKSASVEVDISMVERVNVARLNPKENAATAVGAYSLPSFRPASHVVG